MRAALLNSGLEFPQKRLTVNLAPAHVRKAGPSFDLAIAVGLLAASGQVTGKLVNPLGDAMTLEAPDLVVPRNAQVLVPVRLRHAKDIQNLDFALRYTPAVARLDGKAEKGSLLSDTFQSNAVADVLAKFNFAQLRNVIGTGTVAGFRFKATGAPGSERTAYGATTVCA